MAPLRIGIVGYGKIARTQHLPAIAAHPMLTAVALTDPSAVDAPLPVHRTLGEMLVAHPEIEAVALCQPPRYRHAAAAEALHAGRHVFLEKPPGCTPGEVAELALLAERCSRTLFTAWHSREAAAVGAARQWLAGRTIRDVRVTWREDVRVWHPGQQWLWEKDGFGVLDPGINALSILTSLVPGPLRLERARLERPANRAAPIGALLTLATLGGAPVSADFDFRQTGPQTWDIAVATDRGHLVLSEGGNALTIEGKAQQVPVEAEYSRLYARFSELVDEGRSEVDSEPLRLACEALIEGDETVVAPFED